MKYFSKENLVPTGTVKKSWIIPSSCDSLNISGCILLYGTSEVAILLSTGHRECMEILLAHGVDIDQEDLQHGTPLYVACMYQRTDCVKKLLELGTSGKGAREKLWWY